MMHYQTRTLAVLVLALCGGCANRFKQLYPGMTGEQVVEVMESGPSRAEQFAEGYSAWYYGEDQCVLLREGTVVSKQRTEERVAVATPLGSVKERVRAQCLPPGVTRPESREAEITTPYGEIRVKEKPE